MCVWVHCATRNYGPLSSMRDVDDVTEKFEEKNTTIWQPVCYAAGERVEKRKRYVHTANQVRGHEKQVFRSDEWTGFELEVYIKKQGEKKWRRVHTENQVFFIMNQRPTLLMVQLGAVLSCPVPRTTTRQWRCYKWDIGHTAARILRPLKWSEIESERSCCSFLLFSCQAIRKCVPLEHKGLTHYLLALGFMVLFFLFSCSRCCLVFTI